MLRAHVEAAAAIRERGPRRAASASRTTCSSSRPTGRTRARPAPRPGGRAPLQPGAARGDRDRASSTGRFRARAASASRHRRPAGRQRLRRRQLLQPRPHPLPRPCPGAIGEFFYRDPDGRGLTDTGLGGPSRTASTWSCGRRRRPGCRSSSPRTGSPPRDDRRPQRLPAGARAGPRAPARGGHPHRRATSTGRCSTTSSGSRASGRASGSSRSTTRRSPGGAGRPPTSSPRWAGGSPRERMAAIFRRFSNVTNSVTPAGARQRQRLLVAPADLGRSVGVRGKRDRECRRRRSARAGAPPDTPRRRACAARRRRSRRRTPDSRAARDRLRLGVLAAAPAAGGRASWAGRSASARRRSRSARPSRGAVVRVVERLDALAREARRRARRVVDPASGHPVDGAEDEVPVGAGQPAGELLLVSLGVVGLEAQPDGDRARGTPRGDPRPPGRSRRTAPRASRASDPAAAGGQEVERDVVREADLARGPARSRGARNRARRPPAWPHRNVWTW